MHTFCFNRYALAVELVSGRNGLFRILCDAGLTGAGSMKCCLSKSFADSGTKLRQSDR